MLVAVEGVLVVVVLPHQQVDLVVVVVGDKNLFLLEMVLQEPMLLEVVEEDLGLLLLILPVLEVPVVQVS